MSVIKVAILGFGTVGEGFYRTIQSHAEELTAVLGKKVEVAAILIKNKQKERDINKDVLVTTEFTDILNLPQLDVVVEAIVDKDPTYIFLKKAIERGCHIITANKEMFAHYGQELLELAKEHHVSVGYEATVAGGIPVIQTLRQLLNVNRVQQVQGILNGTSNFILTEMREKKLSFAQALRAAQENGFAEADPTNDVGGFDAFYKAMILSRLAFGEEPNWHAVERVGITSITRELIDTAERLGLRFKHIASISKSSHQLKASVKPVLVGNEHPLYHVEGVQNAVNISSDIVGQITLQGPGAGMFPTASAVIEDLVYVCQNRPESQGFLSTSETNTAIQDLEQKEETWLLAGLFNNAIDPSIKLIDHVEDGTWIAKGKKEEIEELSTQNNELIFFPIIGEYEKEQISARVAL
ncbi:homoserine dehydrogenase [Bacillus sp. AFS076308]|uniref:homoserine dehydrogenase n=1 Tax=unclassified Bacillus (in: firmicutes) TaxID=185979 RepID=UPI000BFA540D|nr:MULTISPECIES: homoserine dehydrogenase [unclassified Bacillus (in: firmicutes)]PFN99666.1 homoserine dehydrogenase [Bacillus sp. AFS076308]PGV44212.1 homoserine dehydrogenase [Bacillus sp. AFS037270]